jgi:uncharacterized protein
MDDTAIDNQQLAHTFHRALLHRDWDLLATKLHSDVTWTLPGDNRMSGTAVGLAGVIERAVLIAS